MLQISEADLAVYVPIKRKFYAATDFKDVQARNYEVESLLVLSV